MRLQKIEFEQELKALYTDFVILELKRMREKINLHQQMHENLRKGLKGFSPYCEKS